MLEVEKRLGKLLAGSTTKAASLQRIADCLVSRKVFEAAPDEETMVIPPKPPLTGWGRLAAAAAGLIVLTAAGAGLYYAYRGTALLRPSAPPPAQPSAARTPLVTQPLGSTISAPTASAPASVSTGTSGTTGLLQRSAPTSTVEQKKERSAGKKTVAAKKKKKKKAPSAQ
jgi:hypothetical protein